MTVPQQDVAVSRRRFVRIAGGLRAGSAVATLLAACGGSAAAPTAAPAAPTAAPKPAATTAPAAGPTPAAAARPTPPAAAQPTAAAAAQAAPVAKSGASLKILAWSHFVPAYDEWLDNYAKSWGEKNKVTITVDHIR